MSADIPPEKLNNTLFKEFLQKYTLQMISDSSTLRKTYVKTVYEMRLEKFQEEIADHPIYISVDETTDAQGCFIAHAIIAPLILGNINTPRLIKCSEIPKADADNIVEFVESSLYNLWPGGIQNNRILLFLSDGAPYMVAAGNLLRRNYGKLIHITCLAHGFHRVAEEIRNSYDDVDRVIADTKLVFLKSPEREKLFKEMLPNIPLSPQPIVTRWGEWLKAASYYSENFYQNQRVMIAVIPDSAVVCRVQSLWRKRNLNRDFDFIYRKFSIIHQVITRLETRGMELEESINVVVNAARQIITDNEISESVCQKIENVLIKNIGFTQTLLNIFLRMQDDQGAVIPAAWNDNDVQCMSHAPITTCDTERSFSDLKSIFRDKRHRFTIDNLEKHVFVYFSSR